MPAEEKEFLLNPDENSENSGIVNNITKIDHWLLFGIGILSFAIVSIWYLIGF